MSKVVLTHGKDSEVMVSKALDELGISPRQKKVVIKPNLIINRPPPVTTPADTVEAIIKYFAGGSKNIIIAEGSGWGETGDVFRALGYEEIARRYGAQLVDLNQDKYEIRHSKQAMVLHEIEFPLTLIDCYLISAASLKTHSLTRVTLSLKNMLGATIGESVSAGKKRRFHRLGLDKSITDLALYKKPNLAIIDGREACLGGELSGVAKRFDLMIFSKDPVAADAVGAKILGYEPMSIPHLKLARERGLGMVKLAEIKVKEVG
ncbi:MAG: DUF362 domain-containing protein [Dehalococcoidia bacterium]|nr:MAG: DUF362 domain-containing protein [Dehalococcoidia bacterium]